MVRALSTEREAAFRAAVEHAGRFFMGEADVQLWSAARMRDPE